MLRLKQLFLVQPFFELVILCGCLHYSCRLQLIYLQVLQGIIGMNHFLYYLMDLNPNRQSCLDHYQHHEWHRHLYHLHRDSFRL